jgi:hypothetical protein
LYKIFTSSPYVFIYKEAYPNSTIYFGSGNVSRFELLCVHNSWSCSNILSVLLNNALAYSLLRENVLSSFILPVTKDMLPTQLRETERDRERERE